MRDDDPIVPETKNWAWVLERPCPECGLAVADVPTDRLGALLRGSAEAWADVLARPTATSRPRPDVWSPLEYACHVRDVHRVFAGRLAAVLAEDEPGFADWDQDRAALAGGYARQDPGTVTGELIAAARRVADRYDAVPADAWSRRGVRSDGTVFTAAGLGRYHLHDVVHHLHDVSTGWSWAG